METAGQELEELREMKEDVERRERAQATVIENQAKRLDELETLYKVCFAIYIACQGRSSWKSSCHSARPMRSSCCSSQYYGYWLPG